MTNLFRAIKHRAYIIFLKTLIRVIPSAVTPMSFVGKGATAKLAEHISRMDVTKILIVSDKPLVELGIVAKSADVLTAEGVEVTIYDGVLPDPTLDLAEACLKVQQQHKCDGVLAIGGGSAIDTAKTVAGAATNGGSCAAMLGFFKVKKQPLPLFAIPTTSGTGSEVTFGAVISDAVTHEKHIVGDPKLTPKAIALDPELITGLPPAITAATGMDALTHAVEAYVSVWANQQSDDYAEASIKMIFKYLPEAYSNGSSLEAREQMSIAAYYAGLAINTAAVGNVHAIAHQFGAWYGVPHGHANAVVLPHVLRFSKEAITDQLAKMADILELGNRSDSNPVKAHAAIEAIANLNETVGINHTLDVIKREDITAIATRAVKEGATYPVPKLMDQEDCENMIKIMCA